VTDPLNILSLEKPNYQHMHGGGSSSLGGGGVAERFFLP